MRVICIDNITHVYKDGSTDHADTYLTVGKIYEGELHNSSFGNIFIEKSDMGGFPTGHKWWNIDRFKFLDEVRQDKLNELL